MQLIVNQAGSVTMITEPDSLEDAIASSDWCWLDVSVDELTQPLVKQFLKLLSVHELALSDAKRERHPPKYEAFEENVFLILREDCSDLGSLDFDFSHVAVFWAEHLVLTIHRRHSRTVQLLSEELQSAKQLKYKNSLSLVTRMARLVSDRFTERLLAAEARLDEMEDSILDSRSDDFLHEMLRESTTLKRMTRSLRYQSDAVELLLHEHRGFSENSEHELQDVVENVDRAATMAQMLSEISVDLMNAFLSLHAHRLNRIMQVLTVLTAIFLPLGLMAGIYGMNFENMPELRFKWGYPILLSLMASCVIGMLFLFRRLRWL